ncbi:hypothetical protein AA100600_2650 [Gluconobacter thailandicus F149-1 = NBRC 100600]|nr:hypothetical protein AA100600_2650 [Gluconobacter thailandicus F149-1 = NBRC 100600]
MTCNEVKDQIRCIPRLVDKACTNCGTKILQNLLWRHFEAGINLAAISTRRSPAGLVRIQNDNIFPGLSKMQSG